MGFGVGRRAGSTEQIGDERAGRQAREKKKLRKKEERREARERERERERENSKCLFNERRERSVIKKYFF